MPVVIQEKPQETVIVSPKPEENVVVAPQPAIDVILSPPVDIDVSFVDSSRLPREIEPTMTYAGETLIRIDYASSAYKILNYTGDILTSVDFYKDSVIYRKTLSYDLDGKLLHITESIL